MTESTQRHAVDILVHRLVMLSLFLGSAFFWIGLFAQTYDYTAAWYLVFLLFILASPFIMGNLNFIQLAEEKGAVFAIKNINRVVSLTILQIKRDFSEDDEVSMAKKRQEEKDLKFLLGEGE